MDTPLKWEIPLGNYLPKTDTQGWFFAILQSFILCTQNIENVSV